MWKYIYLPISTIIGLRDLHYPRPTDIEEALNTGIKFAMRSFTVIFRKFMPDYCCERRVPLNIEMPDFVEPKVSSNFYYCDTRIYGHTEDLVDI